MILYVAYVMFITYVSYAIKVEIETHEQAFVEENEERLAEIEERLKSGEYDEMFAVEELSGGMKTPTSLHEMNAQRQVFLDTDFLFS